MATMVPLFLYCRVDVLCIKHTWFQQHAFSSACPDTIRPFIAGTGAATTAGDSHFRDWEVKMLGRWSSTAYNVYLRNPKVTATFASRLVSIP
jgi:hypothetical protein